VSDLVTGWEGTTELGGLDSPLGYGYDYVFDFDAGQFTLDGASVALTPSSPDSIIAAIRKELRTKRYAFLAYDRNYGSDAFDTIAHSTNIAGVNVRHLLEIQAADIVEHDNRVLEGSPQVTVAVDTTAETISYHIVFTDTFGVTTTFDDSVSYA